MRGRESPSIPRRNRHGHREVARWLLYVGPPGGGAAGLVPMGGNVAAGGVGSGYAYEEPDLVEADADYTAATADQLDAALDARTPENPVTV